jgi:hypothetical protein
MNTVTHDGFRNKGPARPVDPDVKIPPAVKAAAERAEAAQRQAYNIPDPNQPPQDPPAPASPQPPAPPQKTPLQETPPQEPPAPQVAETGTPDSWENRFKAEQGRNRKMKELLEGANTRIDALENLLSEARRAPPAPTPAAAPSAAAIVASAITDKEREELGPEMIGIMERIAAASVAPYANQINELKSTNQDLASRLNGTATSVARSSRATMMAALDSALPNWKEVNVLPEFKAWLALPDPLFGVIRNSRLQEAWEQNDTTSVLAFFKGFVSELATVAPNDPVSLTPPALQPDKGKLESLAAPGRARTPAQTTPPAEKQIITTADIDAFYAAKRRGDYVGREQLFNELEQELFLAQREGRVRATK